MTARSSTVDIIDLLSREIDPSMDDVVDSLTGSKHSDRIDISEIFSSPSFELEEVILDGFGPHDGPNSLKLADGLTMVMGENGVGKTHILLAVNWCIFGDRGSLDPWMGSIDPFGSELINWNRELHKDQGMEVETTFKWDGSRYRIKRTFDGKKNPSRSWIWCEGEWESIKGNPQGLDPDILPYLLFQGEAVMFLSGEGYFTERGRLETAIQAVSGVTRFQHVLDRMFKVREVLVDRYGSGIEKGLPVEREIGSIQARIKEMKEQIRSIKKGISTLEKRERSSITHYKAALKELSIAGSISKAQEESIKARAQLPGLRSQASRLISGLSRETLRGMAGDALDSALREKDERTRKRLLSGAYEAQISIVEQVLSQQRCICGTSIGKSGMGKERLRSLLSRLEIRKNELSGWDVDIPWTSDSVLESARRTLAAVPVDVKDIRKVLRSIKKIEEKDDPGSYGVERSPDKLIEVIREHERISLELESRKKDMKKLDDSILSLKADLSKSKKELIKIWGKDRDSRSYMEAIERLDELSGDLKNAIQERTDGMLDDLEKEVNSILKEGRRDDWISSFHVHRKSFIIGVRRSGQSSKRTISLPFLSAGEREAVASLVVISLSRISNSGLVLDSPFPYMDSGYRNNILSKLPMISGKVLVTIPTGTFDENEIRSLYKGFTSKGKQVRSYLLSRGDQGSKLKMGGDY